MDSQIKKHFLFSVELLARLVGSRRFYQPAPWSFYVNEQKTKEEFISWAINA